MNTRTLDTLSPVRAARAQSLLKMIDRLGGAVRQYDELANLLVRQYRGDTGWARAEFDRALDDLAAAGVIAVEAGNAYGTLVVRRLQEASG